MSADGGRERAVAAALAQIDDGRFFDVLARRVAHRTESQRADSAPQLLAYLTEELRPALEVLGFDVALHDNPVEGCAPFLVARRDEGAHLPTLLSYGHADVIRGMDDKWAPGLSPWTLLAQGERWYGRGSADNKAQHSLNLMALGAVLAERGALGFNAVFLFEAGEEVGSPGLHAFCTQQRKALAADVLIASDGPRLAATRPTLFMGSRGNLNFDLSVDLRAGAHHSGNWGGLLANPGVILAHALACIIDRHGRILVPGLEPESIPASVRAALANCPVESAPGDPTIDDAWGREGLSRAEKVYGWNTFEVLAFTTGQPEAPVNAIPPRARAHCQIRFTVDRDPTTFLPALRAHLDAKGFEQVQITAADKQPFPATRLDPAHPAVQWAAASVQRTLGSAPALLPNLGGSLPNDCFAGILGLPTLWVPHSYADCAQHAPNEHVLQPLLREGAQIMAGLFWDFADVSAAERAQWRLSRD